MTTPERVAARPDWADKKAKAILPDISNDWFCADYSNRREVIATALREALADQRATIERLEREMLAWRICAQDMTPGGSEFMSPDAVRAYQRDLKDRYVAAKSEVALLKKRAWTMNSELIARARKHAAKERAIARECIGAGWKTLYDEHTRSAEVIEELAAALSAPATREEPNV
jgi:hypothetical protein